MQKLGGMGSVGNWIKEASDSLLYYHVTGTFHNLKYEVKRGDGKPIVEGVQESDQDRGVSGVKSRPRNVAGEGLDKAGSFMQRPIQSQEERPKPDPTLELRHFSTLLCRNLSTADL